MQKNITNLYSALLISISIIFCSFIPSYYYYKSKTSLNTITVKGLAELDVIADLAIWKLKFITTNNNLSIAEQTIKTQSNDIIHFLKKLGFNNDEIKISSTDTQDLLATPYRNTDANTSRFILSQTITIKTNNITLVEKSIPKTDILIKKGIIFDNSYGDTISYIFTKLNDIKPQMLELATKNAKKSAQEFAKSSNSTLGKIHTANQGVFSILPREQSFLNNENTQIEKKVRVVSTITYWLK